MRVSKKYLAPSIYSYPYWRLKSNIRFYKGVFCLFGHPHSILILQIGLQPFVVLHLFQFPDRFSLHLSDSFTRQT